MKRPFSAYQGDEPYVFVCYAHEDAVGVYPELQRLHDAGVRIWYDEGVSPGARWSDELARALSGAALVLFFCTPRSAKSKHCQDEVSFALDERRPLLVIQDGVVDLPPGLRLQLGPQQSILKHELSAQQFREKLAAAIERHMDAPPATASQTRLAAGSPRRRLFLYSAIVAALVLAASLAFNVAGLRDRLSGSRATPHIESLAVLPLDNFSRDPSQDYFADGMTEMLTANLAQISGLRVISRTSAMQYKGAHKSLPEIARELNVDAIVEGSVLSSEGKVRVTAQLIYAPDDLHLWAATYDRSLSDVLLLQSEVARTIADQIEVTLTPKEELQLTGARRVDPVAQDAYLRGRYYWQERDTAPENLKKALEYFEQALEHDPRYAPAYVGIAQYYSVLPIYSHSTPDEVFPKAKAAVARALELDDTLSEGHATLAYIRTYYDWDWAGAEVEFRRSLALNSNDSTVLHWYSRYLASSGRIDEALAQIEHARELDPLEPGLKANVGVIYYFGRRYDQAIKELKEILEKDPEFSTAHWGLGLAYEQKKMYSEAIAELEKAGGFEDSGPNTVASMGHVYAAMGDRKSAMKALDKLKGFEKEGRLSPYQLAVVYAGLGETDKAFESLDAALQMRSTLLTYLKMDPRLDSLRKDPRFGSLIHRIGIPA
ncbi:MAG TPA: TIR domain-containing protein [Steroidobacteraceae bacterium]